MSTFAAIGVYSRSDDWILALAATVVAYFILYPLWITYLRYRRSRRIRTKLVTSAYKPPVKLTPAESAYIFSTRVNKKQLYGTLLDLANRSILHMQKREGRTKAELGPKVANKLYSFEKMLVDQVSNKKGMISVDELIEGFTKKQVGRGNTISGSKQYVFWWLLRDSMRNHKIIEPKMVGRYILMLMKFSVVGGFIVTVIPLVTVRLAQSLDSGEVDIDFLTSSLSSGLVFWLLSILPLILVGFVMLRFKGRMLGRSWLLTPAFARYLGQLDAYREFVRLTHAGKLHFESNELKKESIDHTRPYAIAFGYIKQ